MKVFITKTVCALLLLIGGVWSANAQNARRDGVERPITAIPHNNIAAMFSQATRGEVVFSESFDVNIPSTWTNLDADGDGREWEWKDITAVPTMSPYAGGGCVASVSWDDAVLYPDNWLISPSISVSGTATLKFYVASQDPSYPMEHYGVYVSTSGTSVSDFTLIFEETLSLGEYIERNIELGSYSGSIYFAFRHFNSSDQFAVKLDEVSLSVDGSAPSSYDPPINVQASVVNTGNVNVTWVDPNFAYEGWITYAKSGVTGRVGYSETEGADMMAAIRYTPQDMANLLIKNGSVLSKVQLGMGKDLSNINTMEVKIWQGATSMTNPGTEVCTQVINNPGSLVEEEWNEITLTTPVTIDVTKELWIGYRVVNTAGYPLGRDSGPVVTGKGEMISINGTWSTNSSYNILYNWCIQGYVTNAKGEPIALSHCGVNDKGRADRASVKRYKVYCDGTLLGVTAATSFTHTNVPYGTHEYCVLAIYAGDIESDQACADPVTVSDPNPPAWTCATGPSLPYSEGFNAATIPSCWTQQNVVGTTNWTFVAATTGTPNTAHSGTHKARFYYNSGGGGRGATTKLISPVLNFGCYAEATLSFWHTQQLWSPDQDTLRIYYRTTATGAWTLLKTYSNNINSWTQEVISLPNLTSTYYVAFEGKTNYGYGIQLDDVVFSVSGAPVAGTNPGATNLQATMPHTPDWYSVNISWTAPTVVTNLVGYNVYRDGLKVSGNTPLTTTSFVDMAPYAGTFTYAVETVWSDACPSERVTTTVVMPISPCDSPIVSFPYKEGFEGGATIPQCWTQKLEKGDSLWRFVPANYGRIATAHGGSYKAMYRGWNMVEQAAKLITPVMDLSGGDAQLSFWYNNERWLSGQDILRIYYRTSKDGEWVLLETLDQSVTVWTQVTIPLPNPTSSYYIAFEGNSNYGYGIFLDDIQVDGCAILEDLPYAEGFENSFPNFPGCWTQTHITGTANWKVAAANGGGSPSTTNSGTYKALFYAGTSAANVNRLEGPIFGLGSAYDYLQFSFWHTQASWAGDIDNLRVYTQTSADGDWTKIAEYTGAVATWTQRIFDVNVSPYFRFGFEATNDYGYGVHLDDIKIVGCNKIKQFPWTESFALTGVANNTVLAMDCWNNDGLRPGNPTTTPNAPWKFFSAAGTAPAAPLRPGSTGGMIQFNSYSYPAGAKGTLTTPPIVSPTGEKYLEVSFWMYRDNGSSSATYATEGVNLYITNTKDITGATPRLFVPRASTFAPTATANTWNKYSVIIDPATAGTFYITLEGVSAKGNNIYVDDLTIQPYECTPQDLNMVESFEGPNFFPPICWSTTPSGSLKWDRISVSQHPEGVSPQDGNQMIRLNCWTASSGSADMISRGFNTDGKNQILSFWMYRDNGMNSPDQIQFYINSTPSATGATAVGSAYYRNWTLDPVETKGNGWYQYFLELPCANMPVAYLILRGTSDWGNDIHVDNIQVGDLCIPVQNVAAYLTGTNYPQNNASVTWDAPSLVTASLQGYKIYRNETLAATIAKDAALKYDDATNLAPGKYTYCVEAYYNNVCGAAEHVSDSVEVFGLGNCPPPAAISYEKHTDDWYDVDLSWTDPSMEMIPPYCGAIDEEGIGGGAIAFDIAIRYAPADLTPFAGKSLLRVSFAPQYAAATYSIKVWTGGTSATNPGTLVTTQVVPADVINVGNWCSVKLNTPVTIDATKELWIGVNINTTGGYPAGCDAGPITKDEYSNLMYINGSWITMNIAGGGDLPYNWCIKGEVVDAGVTAFAIGYKVFKDGDLLTPGYITETTYRDRVPGPGTYHYEVAAVYDSYCESAQHAQVDVDMEPSPCETPWTVPIFESFDEDRFTPWCWQNIAGAGGRLWQRATTGSSPSCSPHSGAGMLFFNSWSYGSGQTALLATPFFTTDNDYTLKFWMYRDSGYPTTSADRVNIYLSATTSITGLTPLLTVHRSTTLAPEVAAPGWYEYTVQLPTAGMNGAYVIFEGASGYYGNNIYVDDITILNDRACDPVQNIAVTQPKEGEVHFTWEPPLPTGFVGVKVIRNGLIVAPMVTDLFYTDHSSVGTHNYCFVALYDKPECTQALPLCFDVNVIPQCDPVSEVTATVISANKVLVSWTSVNALNVVSYSLYRDGNLLAELTTTVYTDIVDDQGVRSYSVVVNYSKDCQMSDPTTSNNIFIESCDEVTNLQADASAEAVVLTWEHPNVAKAKANREVVFTEGFDAGIPSTWTNLDADGDGNKWVSGITLTGAPYAGADFVTSESYINYVGALTPDNWLITPAITINGEGTVHYYIGAQDDDDYAEHYGVYVSTTGTDVSDFTLVFEETYPGAKQMPWIEKNIPLGQYNGNVYIAFRHFNCTDQFRLNLDEVSVSVETSILPDFSFNIYKDATLLANITEPTYTDTDVSEGATYTYCVKPVYEFCQVDATCKTVNIPKCVPFDVYDVLATGIEADTTAYITWKYDGEGAAFDILRDNVKIATTSEMSYTDHINYNTRYRYCVVPVDPSCPGGASACDTVFIDHVGIVEGDLKGFSIFPNPVSSHVTVKGKNIVQIDVYNAIGQMVETMKVAGGESASTTVDVSNYESGTYIFKVHGADKAIITKPIVVSRH